MRYINIEKWVFFYCKNKDKLPGMPLGNTRFITFSVSISIVYLNNTFVHTTEILKLLLRTAYCIYIYRLHV